MCFAAEMCPHCENSIIKTRILARRSPFWIGYETRGPIRTRSFRAAHFGPLLFTDNSIFERFFF